MNLDFALDNIKGALRRKYRYFLIVCVLPWLLTGCLATRYLKPGEKLLYRQAIKAPKGFPKEGLSEMYVQKANRKLPGLPINTLVWMYYFGAVRYDRDKYIVKRQEMAAKYDRKIEQTSSQKKKNTFAFRKQKKLASLDFKIENGNMPMQWGEAVAVFDTTQMEATAQKFNDYMFIHGYFQGTTSTRMREFERRVGVTYTLKPGKPYFFDTLVYDVPDTTVLKIVKRSASNSFVKIGEHFNQDNLNKERERIDLLLKDNGYFDFSKEYIDFQIDTTFKQKHQVAVRIRIENPPRRNSHRQFRLDSIAMTTDVGAQVSGNIKRQSEIFHNITFTYFDDQYKKKVLSQRLFIARDSLYSRSQTFASQRQLANLDVFKFVNINYDTSGGKFIANVFTSPLERYALSNEIGLTVTQGFPGPYINLGIKKRNLFRGLEIGEINGRFGFEGVASATETGNVYKSTEASINGSLSFPHFILPLKEANFYKFARYNPKTKITAGYTYSNRPEYQRGITNLNAAYSWDVNQRRQFVITPISLGVINSTLRSDFDSLLVELKEQGNNLINAFKKSYVSSMIFSVIWNDNYGSREKNSRFIRASLESGGTLQNLWTPKIITEKNLELYQYIRLSLDIRKNVILDKRSSLAYRFNSGIGYAYSSNKVLPYEKNFFAGGSNSVRAWRPRRLGVGSLPPPLSTNISGNGYFDYKYEKPGEMLIEGSIEYRQALFGFISGAAFLDFGNVWAIATTSDERAKFKLNKFYKEFGVGTGFGLRFDFSFLILRFDVGIKVWDPARELGDRFVLDGFRFFKPYTPNNEPVIYNIGIGYPF